MAVSHRPAVDAVTPLRVREVHVFRPGKPKPTRVYDQHSQLVTNPETAADSSACRFPPWLLLSTSRRTPDLREGLARRLDQSGELVRLERERSRKTRVLSAAADGLRWQSPGGKAVRQPPERLRKQAEPDLEVGGEGQVGSVLLDRGDGQDGHRIAQLDRIRVHRRQGSATTGPDRQPWFEGSLSRA